MAKLTSGERKALPDSAFAVDGNKRKYPINDKSHARNALARVSQHGSSTEKSQVRSAVKKKYPGIIVSPEGIQGPKMKSYGGRHTKG